LVLPATALMIAVAVLAVSLLLALAFGQFIKH
jgi:hypothetical protein